MIFRRKKEASNQIPFWRDIRVFGIIGQILFILLIFLFFRTIGSNFITNIGKLGRAQFICQDGSYNLKCAFDFMRTPAGFGIAESVIPYEVTDSYWQALKVGLFNTLKVSLLAILFSTIIGVVVGIARLSNNWLIKNVACWYVEIIRNTPLLVQIVFIYFVVFLTMPSVNESLQPLGLPIFLSRRAMVFPAVRLMPSSAWIIAFIVLGLIQFQISYRKFSESSARKHKQSYAFQNAGLIFLLIVGIGILIANSRTSSQSILVADSTRINSCQDIEAYALRKAGVANIADLQKLEAEKLTEVSIKICTVNGTSSESNLVSWLQKKKIPFAVVKRSSTVTQALNSYEKGDCDMLAAPINLIAGEKASLTDHQKHLLLPFPESPVLLDRPRIENARVVGGMSFSPEFAGLLLGLSFYAGAFIAEIVRAGIQAIPKGQFEAATALGLTEWQKLRLVILPQSLRVIIPPLISEYLGTIKDSSLGIAIGYPDLYNVASTTLNQSGRSLQVILIIMVVYLTLSLITSAILNWYNNKIRFVEK
jgi:general L-amino acid transport system permease protein